MLETEPPRRVSKALRAAETDDLPGLAAEIIAAMDAGHPDVFRLLAQAFTQPLT
jgi:hypothetical protein